MLPAKIKNCKSSQRVETQEDIEEDPQQKECDEIQTLDQIVLNEGEGDGKNSIVNKIVSAILTTQRSKSGLNRK